MHALLYCCTHVHLIVMMVLSLITRVHNTKNRESIQLPIPYKKSLRQVFCNPLYIFEKQSVPFTGSEALLIAVD